MEMANIFNVNRNTVDIFFKKKKLPEFFQTQFLRAGKGVGFRLRVGFSAFFSHISLLAMLEPQGGHTIFGHFRTKSYKLIDMPRIGGSASASTASNTRAVGRRMTHLSFDTCDNQTLVYRNTQNLMQ